MVVALLIIIILIMLLGAAFVRNLIVQLVLAVLAIIAIVWGWNAIRSVPAEMWWTLAAIMGVAVAWLVFESVRDERAKKKLLHDWTARRAQQKSRFDAAQRDGMLPKDDFVNPIKGGQSGHRLHSHRDGDGSK